MTTEKRILLVTAIFLFALSTLIPVSSSASVESKLFNTISTEAPPIGIATSIDGVWTFVLAAGGKVYVYSADGQLNDIVEVDPTADGIYVAGTNRLYVSSREKKHVQLIALDFSAVIDVADSPFLGPEKAPVSLVIFSDFECPFCAKIEEEIAKVVEKNPETVKVYFKNFPLPNHKHASLAGLAAIAAHRQGKFWQFHNLLFENQESLGQPKILELAKQAGLNIEQFNKDVGSAEVKEKLAKDIRDGQGAGVKGTPTIYVNGREAAQMDLASLQQMIDHELSLRKKLGKKE